MHHADGVLQAPHLGLDLLFRHQVMLDVERGRREQVCAPDRDPARDRNAMQCERCHRWSRMKTAAARIRHYSPSPNLSLMSAVRAAMHSCSSAPSASSVTLAPLPAASIITPM